ncbi:DUF6541 family protein [Corynebacterium doosanense]|uniref:Membrane protein n=1 Tax=Corynebacterium doosanense CAU 212 = DSM 45436 TaxID=558173 RepID=A0A097IDX3_9CORY|nr:DUF6541 family protein [Corynebacterium doosanense]AIT60336.1 membrane protein [Corynebacterium doosanense CAU 212 = DSM 45436]
MDTTTIAVLTAIGVIFLPGAVISWVSGAKLPYAAVAAIPVSFAVYGVAGWVFGLVDIRFGVLSAALFALFVTVVAALWRYGARRLGRRFPVPDAPSWRVGSALDPRWILPAAGVAAGSTMFITRMVEWLEELPGGRENIIQGWDVHWHANVVRFMMDEGVASAVRMGELHNIETSAPMFYPAAFHAAAALLGHLAGLSPIAATSIMGIVIPAVAMPMSVALLAWKMVGNGGLTAQIAAGLSAVLSFALPAVMWTSHYVGAWPYLAAVASSGLVVALFLSAPRQPVLIFAAALSLTGLTQLHPSASTIVVLLVGLYWLLYLVFAPADRGGSRSRLRDLAVLASAGILGFLLMLPQVIAGADDAETLVTWTATEDVSRTESWIKALTMNTRHVEEFFPGYDPTILLWVAGIGAVALILWRRNLWAPVFWFVSVCLTVHALKPFDVPVVSDVLTLIGGLHYATPHRLIIPVAMMATAFAGVGLAVALRLITGGPVAALLNPENTRARTLTRRATAIAAVVLSLPLAWGVGAWSLAKTADGAEIIQKSPRLENRMVTAADVRAWDWLAQQPRAYEGYIAGDPGDGSGWMYAYNRLPSLYRHYFWPTSGRDSATDRSFWNANLIGQGQRGEPDATNMADEAVEELGVNYIVLSPHGYWATDPPLWEQQLGLWTAKGVTPVYKDGRVVIFAVDDNFTLAELREMRAESPEPLPRS